MENKTISIFTALVLCFIIINSCTKDDPPIIPLPDKILEGDIEFEIFENTLVLNGIDLEDGLEGQWKVIQNSDLYSLSDSLDPKCIFFGELLGEYRLMWTVTNGVDIDYEEVSIKIIGFTDSRDSVKYRAVRIGNQIWMAENLRSARYANGDLILDGRNVGDYSNENQPKYWFVYDDLMFYEEVFGRLYTWYTVTDEREISPDGWHIPSDSEWNELQLHLDMNPIDTNLIGISENMVSGLLKEVGTSHWKSPNLGATNTTGFTALPSGYRRQYYKEFTYLGQWVFYWTSTEANLDNAYFRSFSYDTPHISRSHNLKNYGYSVRCIKN